MRFKKGLAESPPLRIGLSIQKIWVMNDYYAFTKEASNEYDKMSNESVINMNILPVGEQRSVLVATGPQYCQTVS